ncbi:TonB-dependent receptor [Phenylobacterium sp. LjRoot219]|uniref:TonB-dependent receptor n=1 Tax=Phenylobacterium sp. LjRoot219 TaxID=3342283 RepID=UPI003ECE7E78
MAQVEEVIVTARKREEALQSVPVVETAIAQETLEKYAIQDLYGVAARVPGILIGAGIGAIGQQISIRGIGTTAQNPTIDQSVSLNVDGLQLSQSLAYQTGMFDVGLVEVLRGPQALFFGKNSPAGVISLRSADPTSEHEVIVRAGYEFEAKEKVGELIVSGPVSENLKLRLATRYSDQEGFFKNVAVATPGFGTRTPTFRNMAPEQAFIVRGTALFNAGSVYTARLKLNYSQNEIYGGGFYGQTGYCPDGTGGVPPRNIAFLAGDDCKVNRNAALGWMDPSGFPGIANAGMPFSRQYQRFGTLEQNLALGENFTLTSVTGGYDLNQKFLIQGSGVPAVMTLALDNKFRNHQFTQELRLNSDFKDSPVNFMVGGFYQNGKMEHDVTIRSNITLGLPPTLQSVLHQVNIRSVSAFGQAMWDITPELELAAGARWTNEKRTHVEINRNPANGPIGPLNRIDPKIESDNVSPEVSLTYRPTDELTLFTSYKEGFKSGSFNTIQFVPATTRASFDDERVRGWEAGLKSRLFDRRLQLNVAGYNYKYSDLQVGANERNPDGTIALRTLNAASAKVYGVDFDATYSPPQVQGLTLSAAVNWNRSRYETFNNAPCGGGQTIAEGCNQLFNPATQRFSAQDLSGQELVRAPEWMGFVGVDYERPLSGGLTLALGANASYTSEYSTALINAPGFYQDAYGKLNANIALRGREDAWEVALIGNNLTNEIVAAGCTNSNPQNGSVLGGQISGGTTKGPAGDDEAACIPERGRYVGLRVTFRPLRMQ